MLASLMLSVTKCRFSAPIFQRPKFLLKLLKVLATKLKKLNYGELELLPPPKFKSRKTFSYSATDKRNSTKCRPSHQRKTMIESLIPFSTLNSKKVLLKSTLQKTN